MREPKNKKFLRLKTLPCIHSSHYDIEISLKEDKNEKDSKVKPNSTIEN